MAGEGLLAGASATSSLDDSFVTSVRDNKASAIQDDANVSREFQGFTPPQTPVLGLSYPNLRSRLPIFKDFENEFLLASHLGQTISRPSLRRPVERDPMGRVVRRKNGHHGDEALNIKLCGGKILNEETDTAG